MGSGTVRALRPGGVSEDFGLEGVADLYPAEYTDYVRRDQAICARSGTPAGTRAPEEGGKRHEEGAAREQDLCGLVAERRSQDYCLRVLAARQGGANRVDARDMGRGRELL